MYYFCVMNQNEIFINRCLQLAKKGLPAAMPNPSVGAVLVLNNKIIGEGYTAAYGGNHAEVNAINAVKDKSILAKCTLYVSLEPCSHYGKTPPCADLIIKYQIKKVVIGTLDSNKKVAGAGVQKLINAGILVEIGVLEQDCYNLNKRFFTYHNKKRPFIVLKWAESFDGFIAPKDQQPLHSFAISNEISRQLVHKWRSEEQAILVGTTTVLQDNPKLDVRSWVGKNPVRIVLDPSGKIDHMFYVKDQSIKTIIFTEQKNTAPAENIMYENLLFDKNLPASICAILYNYEIQSVLIEGGTKTLHTFIDVNLWDEARVFKTDQLLIDGVKAPKIKLHPFTKTIILNDELYIFSNND